MARPSAVVPNVVCNGMVRWHAVGAVSGVFHRPLSRSPLRPLPPLIIEAGPAQPEFAVLEIFVFGLSLAFLWCSRPII